MEEINRYTHEEVLGIFQANYIQHEQIYPNYPGEQLSFDITIQEWINICDLSEPYQLSDYLNYFFELDFSMETWLYVIQPKNKKTLGELCNFISEEALKPVIAPVRVFGSDCQNAAIFKYLMSKFEKKGIDVKTIRPSTLVEPFAKKNLGVLVEEVNKINPQVLPPVRYKDNVFDNMGGFLILLGVLAGITSIWVSNLDLIIIILFGMGFLLIWIGSRLDPKETSFEGLSTFRDLILKINNA